MLKISYSDKALKFLSKLKRIKAEDADVITDKIEQYANNPASVKNNVKALHGPLKGLYRLRYKKYRIIFDNKGRVMYISDIDMRKDVYGG